MDLHLDEEQSNELHRLLTHELGELSSEIVDTDNPSFQRALRARRRHLQEIERQLTRHHATASEVSALRAGHRRGLVAGIRTFGPGVGFVGASQLAHVRPFNCS